MAEVGEGTGPRRVPSSAAGDVPRAQSPGLLPRRMTPNFFGIWFALVVLYLAQGVRQIRADLHDVVLAPFPSLALSTGMLLSAASISPIAKGKLFPPLTRT